MSRPGARTSDPTRVVRSALVAAVLWAASGWSAADVAGQETAPLAEALKEARTPRAVCAAIPGPDAVSVEPDRAEAAALLAQADDAALLGDADEALRLLRDAAALDPSSPEVAYRLGRSLEEANDVAGATSEYCRFLGLEATGSRAEDALERLGALVEGAPPSVDSRAESEFARGLERARFGDLASAEAAFSNVLGSAPDWPEPWYNRSLVRAEAGDAAGASADLAEYLRLRPGASDAGPIQVRIAAAPSAPDPAAPARIEAGTSAIPPAPAFATNALFPGLGQFRSGRPLLGAATFAAAAGAVAFGVMSDRRVVRCIVVPIGGECPEGQVAGTELEKPYLAAGVGAAVLVSVLGALEQQLWYSRAISSTERVGRTGPARLELGAEVRGGGEGVDLSLVRLRF